MPYSQKPIGSVKRQPKKGAMPSTSLKPKGTKARLMEERRKAAPKRKRARFGQQTGAAVGTTKNLYGKGRR